MPKRFIDLSLAITDIVEPGPFPTKIQRVGHKEGVEVFSKFVRERFKDQLDPAEAEPVTAESFADQEFLSQEIVTITVHTGTHFDAPYHFGSRSEGRPAKTIDQIPLEWCYGPGVVLDLSHKAPADAVTVKDIKSALKKIKYTLRPMDIVLIRTGADRHWETPKYYTDYPGMSPQATDYILDQGIKVIGIDSFGFDRPFPSMIGDYLRTKDSRHLWPAHFHGRKREYCHIERLAHLDQLPAPFGFTVACFPIKIKGAGAGWVRVVAMVEDKKRSQKT